MRATQHVRRSKGNEELGRGNARRAHEGENDLRVHTRLNSFCSFPFERKPRRLCVGTFNKFNTVAIRCFPLSQLMHSSESFRVFFDELESNFVTCSVIINILVCQVFQANSDRHTIVTNTFPRSVLASYIRVHPQSWYSWVSMRVEFIGCPIGEYPYTSLKN